jgi:hypothetical protein
LGGSVTGLVLNKDDELDNLAPVLTLDDSIGKTYEQNSDEVDWTLYIDEVSDDTDQLSISDVVIDSSDVDFTQVGDYDVIYSVTDLDGLTTSVNLTITVLLPEAPQITFIEDFDFSVNIGQEIDYTSILEVNDNKDDDTNLLITVDDSNLDTSVPGEYEITITVRDTEGNETVVTKTIVVEDKEAPLILLSTTAARVFQVNDTMPDLSQYIDSVTDNVDLIFNVSTDTSLDMTSLGEYTVVYSVEDTAGNIGTAELTIEIVDTIAPELLMNDVFDWMYSLNEATPEFDLAIESVSDNYDVLEISDVIIDFSEVDMTSQGTYSVYFTLIDESGNETTITKSLMVGYRVDISSIILFDTASTDYVYELEDGSRVYMITDQKTDVIDESDYRQIIVGIDASGTIAWTIETTDGNSRYDRIAEVDEYIALTYFDGTSSDLSYLVINAYTGETVGSPSVYGTVNYSNPPIIDNELADGSIIFRVYIDGSEHISKWNTDLTFTNLSANLVYSGYNTNMKVDNHYMMKDTLTNEFVICSFMDSTVYQFETGISASLFNYYVFSISDTEYYYYAVNQSITFVDTLEETSLSIPINQVYTYYDSREILVYNNQLLYLDVDGTDYYLSLLAKDGSVTHSSIAGDSYTYNDLIVSERNTLYYTYDSGSEVTLYETDLLGNVLWQEVLYVGSTSVRSRLYAENGNLYVTFEKTGSDAETFVFVDDNNQTLEYTTVPGANNYIEYYSDDYVVILESTYDSELDENEYNVLFISFETQSLVYTHEYLPTMSNRGIINISNDIAYVSMYADNEYHYTIIDLANAQVQTSFTSNTGETGQYEYLEVLSDGTMIFITERSVHTKLHIITSDNKVYSGPNYNIQHIDNGTLYMLYYYDPVLGDNVLKILFDDGLNVTEIYDLDPSMIWTLTSSNVISYDTLTHTIEMEYASTSPRYQYIITLNDTGFEYQVYGLLENGTTYVDNTEGHIIKDMD